MDAYVFPAVSLKYIVAVEPFCVFSVAVIVILLPLLLFVHSPQEIWTEELQSKSNLYFEGKFPDKDILIVSDGFDERSKFNDDLDNEMLAGVYVGVGIGV